MLQDFIPDRLLAQATEIAQKLQEEIPRTEYFAEENLAAMQELLLRIDYSYFPDILKKSMSERERAAAEIFRLIKMIEEEKQRYFVPRIITNPVSESDKIKSQVLELYFKVNCALEALQGLRAKESGDPLSYGLLMMVESHLKAHGFPLPFAKTRIDSIEENNKRIDFLIEAIIAVRKYYADAEQE